MGCLGATGWPGSHHGALQSPSQALSPIAPCLSPLTLHPTDLEQLHLGLYCSPSALPLPTTGSPLLTWKWQHSLQELDLAGQSFSERDLEQALAAFARGPAPLRALNLTGTKVTLSTVR